MVETRDAASVEKNLPGEKNPGIGPEKLARWVGVFIDMIEDRVARKTGDDNAIMLADLEEILQSVRSTENLQSQRLYNEAWEELSVLFEQLFWMQERKFPLERLLVKHFAILLADRGKPPEQGRTLSRRVIPAFLYALQQMVGPEMLHEYEDRSHALVQSAKEKAGGKFEWSRVYDDPSAKIITNDILAYAARYFTDIAKRRQWMVDVFQRMMPSAKTTAEKEWRFGDLEFHMLVGSLYSNLFTMLEKDEGRHWIEERYGCDNLDILLQMKRALDIDFLSFGS